MTLGNRVGGWTNEESLVRGKAQFADCPDVFTRHRSQGHCHFLTVGPRGLGRGRSGGAVNVAVVSSRRRIGSEGPATDFGLLAAVLKCPPSHITEIGLEALKR